MFQLWFVCPYIPKYKNVSNSEILSLCSQHKAILVCLPAPVPFKLCVRNFCSHLCLIFWCPFFLCVSQSTCILSADFTNILITYSPSHTKLALNYVLHEFTWQIKGRTFLVSRMRKWVQLKHCEGWPSARRDSVCFLWESEKQCSVHCPIRALASFTQGTKEGLPSIPQFFR